MAGLSLASCNEDFEDWASPQSNPQNEMAAAYGVTISEGAQSVVVMDENTPETVQLMKLSAENEDISGITVKSFTVNGKEIEYEYADGAITVNSAKLDSLVEAVTLDRSATPHALELNVDLAATLTTGEAVSLSGTATGSLTPYAQTPEIDPRGYALLGQWQGWDSSNPDWMTEVEPGVYQAEITTTDDSNWFKFYEGSGFDAADFAWDAVAFGCAENGDESSVNLLVWHDDPRFGLQTPVIPGAGKWLVTLDMNKLYYKFESIGAYYSGDGNGWGFNPMAEVDNGVFEGYYYIYKADGVNYWGFKFPTDSNWDRPQYGKSNAGADHVELGGSDNIDLPSGYNSGFYKITLNTNTLTYSLQLINSISIVGDAVNHDSGWGTDIDMTYDPAEYCWKATDVELNAGAFKFRANRNWDISWGGEDPNALTSNGGANLSIDADGTYTIKFWPNCDGKGVYTIE